MSALTVVSLFTGAGGLDLGLEAAGFATVVSVECDPAARLTIERNRPEWNLAPSRSSDVNSITGKSVLSLAGLKVAEPTLLAGGPPCQPFSNARLWANGKRSGLEDPRAKTIESLLRLVEEIQPEVLLIENVPGFQRKDKKGGLSLVKERLDRTNQRLGTSYRPTAHLINAAEFGVPQLRRRLFIVAHRDGVELTTPDPTHGLAEIAHEHGLAPYTTAWDAIGDLDGDEGVDDLSLRGKYADILPAIPEGRNYLWFTPEGIQRWGSNGDKRRGAYWGWRTRYWSFLLKLAKNLPSWTISANPGPSTGPFHWKNRQLSFRELARLQTFPDDFEVHGATRREVVRQVGNAVPCALAELFGLAIRQQMMSEAIGIRPTLIPIAQPQCPPPEPVKSVPRRYEKFSGEHKPHPGEGKGPGAEKGDDA